jgi:hypothetical protein
MPMTADMIRNILTSPVDDALGCARLLCWWPAPSRVTRTPTITTGNQGSFIRAAVAQPHYIRVSHQSQTRVT